MSDDLHGVQISYWWSPLSLELNLLGPVGWHKSPASFCSRLMSHLATSAAESCLPALCTERKDCNLN
jgi:hypothetical protein